MIAQEPPRLERLAELATRVFHATNSGGFTQTGAAADASPDRVAPQGPELDEFVRVAYDDGWILAPFDWATWKGTPEAAQLRDSSTAIDRATVVQLARIMTTLIRQDRYAEGTLRSAWETGLLHRVLNRIAHLAQEEPANAKSDHYAEHLQPLREAIRAYDFPTVTFDFVRNHERVHVGMRELEKAILADLVSADLNRVRDGLSNVLYWGFARMGIRDHRVDAFRRSVTDAQLKASRTAFACLKGPGLRTLNRLGLPQFSQVSFLSKVRMFLDPMRYVTLDKKLAKLRQEPVSTVFHDLVVRTSIPVTSHNERVYAAWCAICCDLAARLDPTGGLLAADVERGVFFLTDSGQMSVAASVVSRVST
jgi:hypothetical protein